VGWVARRNPEQALEAEDIGYVLGDGYVADVGWIERAPEEADAPTALPRGCQGAVPVVLSSTASGESGYSSSSLVRASAAKSA